MAATPEHPVLDLSGVVKRYGSVTAVDGLDLTLGPAEVLALLGPNGAGKTTTVEMCEGFITPDHGSVRVLGLDPTGQTDELRGRIGIMLQGGGAYPGIRVGEMLRLAASYCANPLDTGKLLETVGLAGHERASYRRLSGGQQQRLSLALALVGRPELVFLDEPTAGLDPAIRRTVRELIGSLARTGTAVVLTTHLMDDVEGLADHVVVLAHGKAVASGSLADVLAGHRGPGGLLTVSASARGLHPEQAEVLAADLAELGTRHGLDLDVRTGGAADLESVLVDLAQEHDVQQEEQV